MNHLFAFWFSYATWYIPTPNYWEMWMDNHWKGTVLPNIPGI